MNEEHLIQWHPAFYASIQIELENYENDLSFEREHPLSSKPMLIDVLIIKKNTEKKIEKNIGRLFKKYNIVEYKSPDDYLSIDDYYKVVGYTCFYKYDVAKVNEIKHNELTITLVGNAYPRNLIKHLETERNLNIKKHDDGIYYVEGCLFPIQIIVTKELSVENNLWLCSLTNNLKKGNKVSKLLTAYRSHQHDILYSSVMEVIVKANKEVFEKGDTDMCEALKEIMKDEFEALKQKTLQEGLQQGAELKLIQQIQRKIEKGKTLAQIADELEEMEETIFPIYQKLKETL